MSKRTFDEETKELQDKFDSFMERLVKESQELEEFKRKVWELKEENLRLEEENLALVVENKMLKTDAC